MAAGRTQGVPVGRCGVPVARSRVATGRAVSRLWREVGVEEAASRRPRVPARRVGADGPTPLEAGFRRGPAPEGRTRGRKVHRDKGSNELSELLLNLAAMTLNLDP